MIPFPKRAAVFTPSADSPSHALGTETRNRVDYKEAVMVGYRYYDTRNVTPQFPFGYGLSYTTFSFGPMTLKTDWDHRVTGHLAVTNTGDRDGTETVEIYVKPLRTGETRQVDFTLEPEAFRYFDPSEEHWTEDDGEYEIQAGKSSREILSTARLTR